MKTVAIAVALTLGGCQHIPPTVWPKSAGHVALPDWKDDGGQSLEPQGSITTDIEASDDAPAVAATEIDADKAKTATPSPAATPAVKGEVIFSDEIIIDLPNP